MHVTLQRLERSSEMEEAMVKVEEKQFEEVANFIIITTPIIIMIIKINISQSKDVVSECTPRYIGHDIDSEMASNLRMLCLVVLLLRFFSPLVGQVFFF